MRVLESCEAPRIRSDAARSSSRHLSHLYCVIWEESEGDDLALSLKGGMQIGLRRERALRSRSGMLL